MPSSSSSQYVDSSVPNGFSQRFERFTLMKLLQDELLDQLRIPRENDAVNLQQMLHSHTDSEGGGFLLHARARVRS